MAMIFNENFLRIVRNAVTESHNSHPKPPIMKAKSADLIREVLLSYGEFEMAGIVPDLANANNQQLMGCYYGILRKDYKELRSLELSSVDAEGAINVNTDAEPVYIHVDDVSIAFCMCIAYLSNVRSLCSPLQKNLCTTYLRNTSRYLADLLIKYYDSKPPI